MKKKKTASSLQARLYVSANDQSFAAEQIQLLQAVEACGSISAAAKKVGISYKTAWDRIDAMNNMSTQPLVLRSTGGVQGGGTVLTEFGRKAIQGFLVLQEEHQEFLRRLGARLQSMEDLADVVRAGTTQSSARNQYRGEVISIVPGAVNAEVHLRIGPKQNLVATITQDSCERLRLKKGMAVIALVKAPWVMISNDLQLRSSARNKLVGQVARIVDGAVNADVTLDLGDGKTVSAIIGRDSLAELRLQEGQPACALFDASSLVLLVEG